MPFKVICYFHKATINGKNMLPIGSIFFPLRVAPLKVFPLRWNKLYHSKDVCSFVACGVTELETVFRGHIFGPSLCLLSMALNKNTRQI